MAFFANRAIISRMPLAMGLAKRPALPVLALLVAVLTGEANAVVVTCSTVLDLILTDRASSILCVPVEPRKALIAAVVVVQQRLHICLASSR
jgi:hypothetical protein